MCVFLHLGYSIFLASQPCLFLTITQGVRSVLEGPFSCFMFRRFWRWVQNIQVNLRALYAQPSLEDMSWYSWWSLSYLYVYLYIWPLLPGRVLEGVILVLCFPSNKGSLKFSEGMLCAWKRCPGKYFSFLVLTSSLYKEGIKCLLFLISDSIYFVFAVFPLII